MTVGNYFPSRARKEPKGARQNTVNSNCLRHIAGRHKSSAIRTMERNLLPQQSKHYMEKIEIRGLSRPRPLDAFIPQVLA